MYGNEIITIDEMCERLHIGKTSAYSLLKSGEIKSTKVAKKWLIPVSSIDEFINKKCKDSKIHSE